MEVPFLLTAVINWIW